MRSAELVRYLILAAQREGNRQLTARLSSLGITTAQSEALRIIGDHGPLTLTGLGEMLVCESGSNPSRLAERLVSTGLIERSPGTTDRRQVLLTLTPRGRDVAERVRSIEDDFYDALDLAATGVDVSGLVQFLRSFTQGAPSGRALEERLAAEERSLP
jgi:MarR family transcriptional regulator, organic hydroperoxide resistance regulator